MKIYPPAEVTGLIFGVARNSVSDNFRKYLEALIAAETKLRVLPHRKFKNPEALKKAAGEGGRIVFDGTERLCVRHKDKKKQKAHYSGKKRRNTVKNIAASDDRKACIYLSGTAAGSVHDYKLFKKCFNTNKDWFESVSGEADSGFQGMKTDYKSSENIELPHKKQRRSKKNPSPRLTRERKKYNKNLSKRRVIIEHIFGGMKVFNILAARFRNRAKGLIDRVIYAVAGLYNLKNGFIIK